MDYFIRIKSIIRVKTMLYLFHKHVSYCHHQKKKKQGIGRSFLLVNICMKWFQIKIFPLFDLFLLLFLLFAKLQLDFVPFNGYHHIWATLENAVRNCYCLFVQFKWREIKKNVNVQFKWENNASIYSWNGNKVQRCNVWKLCF